MGRTKYIRLLSRLVVSALLSLFLFLGFDNWKIEQVDFFIRDLLQTFNSKSEIDPNIRTFSIDTKKSGLTYPYSSEEIIRIVSKFLELNPKNIILMVEPLDFSPETIERQIILSYFLSVPNLYLNKLEARGPNETFGTDAIFKAYPRFINFDKCSDGGGYWGQNRRAYLGLDSSGPSKIFDDIRKLGLNPKPFEYYKYRADYWNSPQAYVKNFPLGSYGNLQVSDLFSNLIPKTEVENKTIVIGIGDENSYLVSKSVFFLFGSKRSVDFQKYQVPLQDTFANILNFHVTGNYIRYLSNFNDVILFVIILNLIFWMPVNDEKKLYFLLSYIPAALTFSIFIYLAGSFYIDFSRSIVMSALTQYFIFPIMLFQQFKRRESEKLDTINNIRIESLLNLSEQIAHDIRSPLSTIRLLLSRAVFRNAEEKRLIDGAIDEVDSIASDLLLKEKGLAQSKNENKVNVTETIENLTMEYQLAYPNMKFKLSKTADVLILTNHVVLTRVIRNLINNSIAALCDSDEPKIQLRVNEDDTDVTIEVADNAKGITESLLNLLGKRRVHPIEGKKSHGIGILNSKQLIEGLGGKLIIVKTSPSGTTIHIRLPKH